MELTVRDVAQLLDVSEKTIYRWIDQEAIPFYRINSRYRFSRAEILKWAFSRKMGPSPVLLEPPREETGPLPSLAEALGAGWISYRLGGETRDGILKAMVAGFRLPEEINEDALLQAIIARENLASTAIGGGIALPHPRDPIVQPSLRPTVYIFFLERPIEFGSLDGRPVGALIPVLSPTLRAHLHLLSRLGHVLLDPAFRNTIDTQASREQIFEELRRAESRLASSESKGAATGA